MRTRRGGEIFCFVQFHACDHILAILARFQTVAHQHDDTINVHRSRIPQNSTIESVKRHAHFCMYIL